MTFDYLKYDAVKTKENLKKLYTESGYTAYGLHTIINATMDDGDSISPQAVYQWMNPACSKLPSLENLVKLAGIFHTTIDKIVAVQPAVTRDIEIKTKKKE
jgi:hypothetical protein